MEISIIQGNKKYNSGVELNLGLRKTTMTVRDNLYRRAVLIKVLSGFQGFFAKSCKINQILLSGLCSTSLKISIILGNEKIPLWSRVIKR